MAKTKNKKFEFLVWGYQANELAGKVELLKIELAKVKGKLNTFLKENERMKGVTTQKLSVAVLVTVAWLCITLGEYWISADIYAVYLGTVASSVKTVVVAFGIACLAALFSASIMEGISPELSRNMIKNNEESEGVTILDRQTKPFNPRPLFVAFGIVATAAAAYILYEVSCYRVALEMAAGQNVDGSMTRKLGPPLLICAEVLAGIYLPFMICYTRYKVGNKKFTTQISARERERESLEGRVHRLREAHDRDVERHNRQHPDDPIEAVAPSISLLKVLRGRLGKDAVGEIPEEAPDETTVEVSQTAKADPVPRLDADSGGTIEPIADGGRADGGNSNNFGDGDSQAFLQEFEQRLKQAEIEP